MNIEDNMRIKLAEKLGNIVDFEEWIPGVYYIEANVRPDRTEVEVEERRTEKGPTP